MEILYDIVLAVIAVAAKHEFIVGPAYLSYPIATSLLPSQNRLRVFTGGPNSSPALDVDFKSASLLSEWVL